MNRRRFLRAAGSGLFLAAGAAAVPHSRIWQVAERLVRPSAITGTISSISIRGRRFPVRNAQLELGPPQSVGPSVSSIPSSYRGRGFLVGEVTINKPRSLGPTTSMLTGPPIGVNLDAWAEVLGQPPRAFGESDDQLRERLNRDSLAAMEASIEARLCS